MRIHSQVDQRVTYISAATTASSGQVPMSIDILTSEISTFHFDETESEVGYETHAWLYKDFGEYSLMTLLEV